MTVKFWYILYLIIWKTFCNTFEKSDINQVILKAKYYVMFLVRLKNMAISNLICFHCNLGVNWNSSIFYIVYIVADIHLSDYTKCI